MAQQSIGEIGSADQAIIDRLSNYSPAHLFLWVTEGWKDVPLDEQRVYRPLYHPINNVAERHGLFLGPRVVEVIKSHANHHNHLVQLAATPPKPNTLRDCAPLMDQDWTEPVNLGANSLLLLELITKAARQAVPNLDDQENYSSYLRVFKGNGSANLLFMYMTYILMSRLDLYKGALNPFGYRWTYFDIAEIICRHDLDWLVNVLNGHATVFTDQEGADMDSRWAANPSG